MLVRNRTHGINYRYYLDEGVDQTTLMQGMCSFKGREMLCDVVIEVQPLDSFGGAFYFWGADASSHAARTCTIRGSPTTLALRWQQGHR